MGEKSQGNPIVGAIILVVFGFALYSCVSGGSETSEETAARSAKESEDKRKGFHCLSTWDGSHRDFRDAVKSRMRDPDSFEHIETRVTTVNGNGEHTILMQYRARNGFGGMNVGNAIGTFKNSDCRFKITSVE